MHLEAQSAPTAHKPRHVDELIQRAFYWLPSTAQMLCLFASFFKTKKCDEKQKKNERVNVAHGVLRKSQGTVKRMLQRIHLGRGKPYKPRMIYILSKTTAIVLRVALLSVDALPPVLCKHGNFLVFAQGLKLSFPRWSTIKVPTFRTMSVTYVALGYVAMSSMTSSWLRNPACAIRCQAMVKTSTCIWNRTPVF